MQYITSDTTASERTSSSQLNSAIFFTPRSDPDVIAHVDAYHVERRGYCANNNLYILSYAVCGDFDSILRKYFLTSRPSTAPTAVLPGQRFPTTEI